MRAMILGAGRGTRLGSLRVPKILVDVNGEPLLARQLRYLAREGIERVVVNAHHLAEQVSAFASSEALPLALEVVVEPELLGTAGGVRNALGSLGDASFLVLYGDVLVDAPLAPLVGRHRTARADGTLAVYATTEVKGKGVITTHSDGRIRSFLEKRATDVNEPSLVNAGIYVLEPEFIRARVPLGARADFGEHVFPAALHAGDLLVAYILPSPVLDVGTPEALAAARNASRD